MRNDAQEPTGRAARTALVQSVDRALALLDLFASGISSWGISELSRATGMSKATVYRLMRTLERHGYTVQSDDHRYVLGTKALELAGAVFRQFEVRQVARPTMLALAERTGESVVLTAPNRNGVICLDTVDSPQRLRVGFHVGRTTPWHAGAAGKLHMAYLPEERIRRIVDRGLMRYTENTITDPDLLQRSLAQIRRQGVAFTVGEFDPGVAAISAPIVDCRQEVVAALSIGGPAFRFGDDRLPYLIGEVRRAAGEISKRMMGNPALLQEAASQGT